MPFVQEVHAHCVACQFTVLNCEITLIIMASSFRVVTNGSHSGMRGLCDNEKGIRSNSPTPFSHGHREPDLNPVANPDRPGCVHTGGKVVALNNCIPEGILCKQ